MTFWSIYSPANFWIHHICILGPVEVKTLENLMGRFGVHLTVKDVNRDILQVLDSLLVVCQESPLLGQGSKRLSITDKRVSD